MVKQTPDNHPDFGDLKKALVQIGDITEILDQSKKDAENLEKVFNVFHSLTGEISEV
jgi:hypothetical protein